MEDKELYQYLLGLKTPRTVKEVKLNVQAEEIAVQVSHPRGTKFCCPDCQRELACYDHGEQRRWRHLDSASSRQTWWRKRHASNAQSTGAIRKCSVGRVAQSFHEPL